MPDKPFLQDQRNVTPLRAGVWHHVAVCWDTVPGRGWLSEFYIDGRPSLPDTRFKTGLGRYSETGLKKVAGIVWTIETPKGNELMMYGGIDGVVDELRISNAARYPEAFEQFAPRRFEADEHTTLPAHFDGDGETINGRGRPPLVLALPSK